MSFEFVEKDTTRYEDIKTLIKEKCECTCRKAMSKTTVIEELEGSEFVIISLTEIPTSPLITDKIYPVNLIDKYILNGFIVCGIKGSNNDILHIKLLCCLKALNLGSKLINKVVKYAIEKGYKKISLNSLYEDRLIKWYIKQGFKLTTRKIYNIEGKIKESEMEMII
jgi:ribosomal protein S18 acetylase RimI-like enzyme